MKIPIARCDAYSLASKNGKKRRACRSAFLPLYSASKLRNSKILRQREKTSALPRPNRFCGILPGRENLTRREEVTTVRIKISRLKIVPGRFALSQTTIRLASTRSYARLLFRVFPFLVSSARITSLLLNHSRANFLSYFIRLLQSFLSFVHFSNAIRRYS